ncbi:hypothetical protein [Paenibacillus sp. MMS20-IR301]|uniref:hypothetical protein n=1 Tax=Paenibacillus sp. MMS20-IR301 TaxID=2895946 RepID=UPI0028E73951|nr:hypothetical protein [Paenibacillus sp. MMS20-IR301]WNS45718.1 hypothetical protein LOS79_10745 [Paenibacillus sp. MMS20-IR301]
MKKLKQQAPSLALQKVKPKFPVYNLLKIDVRETTIDEVMPTHLYFYVDSRFTPAQLSRIRLILMQAVFFWSDYYEQMDNKGTSDLAKNVNLYARFNLSPVAIDEKLANGRVATDVMMSIITQIFQSNGFQRAGKSYIKYKIPAKGTKKHFTISAVDGGEDLEQATLTVTINPQSLDRKDLGDVTLTGSLFHAWLHRIGYRHPASKYTSYFMVEAALSIMRATADKTSGTKDSLFIKYLD